MWSLNNLSCLALLKRSLGLFLLVAGCFCLDAFAQNDGGAQRENALELEQLSVALPKNHDEVRYAVPPSDDQFPNVAFVVVDRSNQDGGPRVRGIAYFMKYFAGYGGLVGKLIKNDASQDFLLATVKSNDKLARFRIFRVDPNKEIGRYPLQLDRNDYRKWPAELPLLGEIDIDVSSDSGCVVKDLKMISAPRKLQLEVPREGPNGKRCEPLALNFYLESLMWSGEPLAKTSYQAQTGSQRLELVKTPLTRPPVADRSQYFQETGKLLPNWAYVLTDYSDRAAATPRTVWFAYASAESVPIRDLLLGNVIPDPANKVAYVVTLNSGSTAAAVKVYRVDLSATAAPYPFELDRTNYRKWPKDSAPLAQLSIAPLLCQLKNIGVALANDELVISLDRTEGECERDSLRLDLKTLQWTKGPPGAVQSGSDLKGERAPNSARLVEKTYVRGGEKRYLSLWQIVPARRTPDKAQLNEILTTPNSIRTVDIASFNRPVGNNIFAIVDSPRAGDVSGNLIGVVYATGDITLPQAWWSGEFVIEKSGANAYVILARSKFLAITISVHKVMPTRKIADFPYEFEARKFSEWPQPLTQLSELKSEVVVPCGIDNLEAELVASVLVIHASHKGEKCAPTTFRFDSETRTWSGPL